jgi:hypothetical protein
MRVLRDYAQQALTLTLSQKGEGMKGLNLNENDEHHSNNDSKY